VAYVQPHTYSRTRALLDEWPGAFADADVVLVGAIFPSREKEPAGFDEHLAQQLVAHIATQHTNVTYAGRVPAAAAVVQQTIQPGDVLLTLGAGDGYLIADEVVR
jgi:UDP-N-acetylmuramate--alanine ligase